MPSCIIRYAIDSEMQLHDAIDAHDHASGEDFPLPPGERDRFLGTVYVPAPETAHQTLALQARVDAACRDFQEILGYFERVIARHFRLLPPDVSKAWKARHA